MEATHCLAQYMLRGDSNSRPLDHQSSAITTKSWLLPRTEKPLFTWFDIFPDFSLIRFLVFWKKFTADLIYNNTANFIFCCQNSSKNWPTLPPTLRMLCLFRSFHKVGKDKYCTKFDLKCLKYRWCAWASNRDSRMEGADESTELWRHPLKILLTQKLDKLTYQHELF